MSRSPSFHIVLGIQFVAAIALTGCISIETGRQGPEPAQTGPAPSATGPGQQRAALLTLAEVQATPASPGGFEQVPDPDSTSTGTSTSGPCGGRITPPLQASQAAEFISQSAETIVLHAIYRPEPGLADRILGEVRQDMRPGCQPFTQESPVGPATVKFIGEVRLPALGDERLATRSQVRFNDGRTLNAISAAVRSGQVLIRVQIRSTRPVSEAFLIELTTAAVRKTAEP